MYGTSRDPFWEYSFCNMIKEGLPPKPPATFVVILPNGNVMKESNGKRSEFPSRSDAEARIRKAASGTQGGPCVGEFVILKTVVKLETSFTISTNTKEYAS